MFGVKKYCSVLIITILTFLVTITLSASEKMSMFGWNPDYKNNHRQHLNHEEQMVLIENGKSNCEIIISNKAPIVKFAAGELQGIIEQATGVKVSIVRKRGNAKFAISLGENPWLPVWGLDIDTFSRDAFVIKRFADIIVIAGKDDPWVNPEKSLNTGGAAMNFKRGTLFGVYDFAERFLGVRFYFPGAIGTVVPKTDTLKVPEMEIYEAPDFIIRRCSSKTGAWYANLKQEEIKRLKNLQNFRFRTSTWNIPNCHGLAALGYIERFGKKNPEYFSLTYKGVRNNDNSISHSGHLCFSNPDLLNEIYQDAEAFLTMKPASLRGVLRGTSKKYRHHAWNPYKFSPGFFNIMPQDGLGNTKWCRCPKCGPYWDNSTQTELIWKYTVEIADRLKKNGIPGYVTNMAYGVSKDVPKINIPDNVLVMMATEGPWKEKFPEKQHLSDQLIKDWNKKLAPRHIWLWNYAIHALGRYPDGLPPLAVRYIGSYYQRIAPQIWGAYLESEIDYYLFNAFNWYVFNKMAWNSSLDVEELLADHHRKLFGPAAKPMAEFFNKVELLFTRDCLPESKETPLGPVAARRSVREIWEEVFTSQIFDEFNEYFNRAETLAANDGEALKRVKWFRKHYLGKIKDGRQSYCSRKKEIEDLVLNIPKVSEGNTIAINGIIDEPDWKKAALFRLVPLASNHDPVVNTTVKALWNPKYLYLAFDCREPKVSEMILTASKRDNKGIWEDSSVEIFLNPTGNRKNYKQFLINAKGVVSDVSWTALGVNKRKGNWDWNASVITNSRKDDNGYILEIAIPLTELTKEPIKEGTTWVANFCRNRNVRGVTKKENQNLTWSPFLQRGFHNLERYGRIRFVGKLDSAQIDGDNLIKNGGFEILNNNGTPKDWGGWNKRKLPTKSGGQKKSMFIDRKTFREGNNCVMLEGKPTESLSIKQMLPNLKPGTKYLLTYFVKAEQIEPGPEKDRLWGAFLNIWASKNYNRFFPRKGYKGTFSWTKQGIEFETPEDAGKERTCYFGLVIRKASGKIWFDDIKLREVTK